MLIRLQERRRVELWVELRVELRVFLRVFLGLELGVELRVELGSQLLYGGHAHKEDDKSTEYKQ